MALLSQGGLVAAYAAISSVGALAAPPGLGASIAASAAVMASLPAGICVLALIGVARRTHWGRRLAILTHTTFATLLAALLTALVGEGDAILRGGASAVVIISAVLVFWLSLIAANVTAAVGLCRLEARTWFTHSA